MNTPDIDENLLKDKYPNTIKDVKYLSIKDDYEKLETFRNELAVFIRQNSAWNKEFPALWFTMKERLQEKFNGKKDYIVITEFDDICKEIGIKENDDGLMRKSLHDLGICLWYEQIPQLTTLVLNPSWISYGVYKILNWLKEEKKHILCFADFSKIFSKENEKGVSRFLPANYRFLFDIMRTFDLAYPIEKSKEELIIPILLPQKQPEQGMDRDFPVTDSLLIRCITKNTLPPDTISRFIVRHHEHIQTNDNKEPIVWRRGVKLDNKNRTQALVMEYDKEIRVYVRGNQKSKYLDVLLTTLMDIFETYTSNGPTIELMITMTAEQKPVFESIDKIKSYLENKIPYWSTETRSNIDLEEAAVKPYGPTVFKECTIGKVYVDPIVVNIPEGLTLKDFSTLLERLSIFLQSKEADDELRGKDKKKLQDTVVEVKKEPNLEKAWNILQQVTAPIANIATILTAAGIPQAIAKALGA
ncbi:MAG: hypothetical protein LBC12_01065 [Nitrososphaerota archaeon]|jgi:hypothetical protein|nr:hypothetical protein [Nitrososphaerota archaeon]